MQNVWPIKMYIKHEDQCNNIFHRVNIIAIIINVSIKIKRNAHFGFFQLLVPLPPVTSTIQCICNPPTEQEITRYKNIVAIKL